MMTPEILNSLPVAAWLSDAHGKRYVFNSNLMKLFGMSQERICERWTQCIADSKSHNTISTLQKLHQNAKSYELEYTVFSTQVQSKRIKEVGHPLWSPQGEFLGFLGFCYDITQLSIQTECHRLEVMNLCQKIHLQDDRLHHYLHTVQRILSDQRDHKELLIQFVSNFNANTLMLHQDSKERLLRNYKLFDLLKEECVSFQSILDSMQNILINECICETEVKTTLEATAMKSIVWELIWHLIQLVAGGIITINYEEVEVDEEVFLRIYFETWIPNVECQIQTEVWSDLEARLPIFQHLLSLHYINLDFAQLDSEYINLIMDIPKNTNIHKPLISILVVDDDPIFLTIMSRYLRKNGYIVYTTDREEEALSLCYQHPEIQFAFIDLNLNHINGFYFSHMVQGLLENAYLFAITGSELETNLEGFMSSAFKDYIMKPFSAREVLDKLLRIQDEKH